MSQELLIGISKIKEVEDDAIMICKNCEKLVPKTMLCIYCGGHLLYKRPKPSETS
jgi:rRNA maturation endonuclease Nob1